MTDDGTPQTAMERIALLEARVTLLEAALMRAFGTRWMDEQKNKPNESPSE